MCFNQRGNISTLNDSSLKLVDKFTYLGSSVSSTEKDVDTRLAKVWTANDRLSVIWKSDLIDKMKHSFFQAAVVSILLYGCNTWTLTEQMGKKKLDSNYTRMLRARLNKSWRQRPTKQQRYGHLSPITKTIQIRRTRHVGHSWRSRDELISDILPWTPSHGRAKQDVHLGSTYNSSVPLQDVALKIYWERWTIETGGGRWSVRSVLAARLDDDDDDNWTSEAFMHWMLLELGNFCTHFAWSLFSTKHPTLNWPWLIDWLIDFNTMLTSLRLFYAKYVGNRIYIYIFVGFFFIYIYIYI